MSNERGTSRFERLVVGVILLWLTASVAFSLLFGIVHADPVAALVILPIATSCAFLVAGMQTVLYSLLMECCIWRIVGRNVLAILVSSLLGLVCGLSVFCIMRDFLAPLLFAGFFAGLTTGLVLYLLKGRQPIGQVQLQSPGVVA